MKVIYIHLFLSFIHDYHTVRWEGKSEGWDEFSNQQENRPNKMAEGKKAQISHTSLFFMQSHSKENGKYVMICIDITCAQNWTQVCHIYPA